MAATSPRTEHRLPEEQWTPARRQDPRQLRTVTTVFIPQGTTRSPPSGILKNLSAQHGCSTQLGAEQTMSQMSHIRFDLTERAGGDAFLLHVRKAQLTTAGHGAGLTSSSPPGRSGTP